MKTRKDYLEKRATHSEYYGQFVTPGVLATVKQYIGEKEIKQSKDKHFNDIPLAKWDAFSQHSSFKLLGGKMREAGDYLTLSGIVCVAKEAARQIAGRK